MGMHAVVTRFNLISAGGLSPGATGVFSMTSGSSTPCVTRPKANASRPDLKLKKTQEALQLSGRFNPPRVEGEIAAIASDGLQLNLFSWNKRLERYVKAGQYEKTIEHFHQMQQNGINPDAFTFVQVLNACTGLQSLKKGRQIHNQIICNGFEADVHVGSCLMNMYAKCGSIDHAWRVFNKMPARNVVAWSTMILGCAKCGEGNKALELAQWMQWEGIEPNHVTFVGLLNACASIAALDEGKLVHEKIIRRGWESNIFIGTSLVDMYSKCGRIEDALRVFDGMGTRNVVTWNAMIWGYVKSGQGPKALELFQRMQQEGVEPVPNTFVGLLNACGSVAAIEVGRHIHEQVIQRGCESDAFVGNSLIDMYAKCGSIQDAWRVFNRMSARDVVSWNAMILGLVKCGQGYKALELSEKMQQEGVEPNPATFLGVLNACAVLGALEEGKYAHGKIIERGWESDIFVASSLVHMYAKCGSIQDAWRVFRKMANRDVVVWSAMILGYVKCGQGRRALGLFRRMHREGVEPNQVTFVGVLNACASVGALEEGRIVHEQILQRGYETEGFVHNSLVNMYAKCGSIEDAWRVFDSMPSSDVVSWNAMLLGLVKCGQGQKALELSRQMEKQGVKPDLVTYLGLLNACASILALEDGRCVHEQIIQHGYESDVFVGNSLVDMYAKCGSMEDAWKVFKKMPIRDAVSWNATLRGYAMHGNGSEALRLFDQMRQEGVEMDGATFVSLLSACSHSGLVNEGLHYFEAMSSVYGIPITVYHYTCMVDLLGRAGHLQDAEDLVRTMSCEPNLTLWMSLLSGCRLHGDVEMGERIAKQVLQVDPLDSAVHVLLSNIYSAAGNLDRSEIVSNQNQRKGSSSS